MRNEKLETGSGRPLGGIAAGIGHVLRSLLPSPDSSFRGVGIGGGTEYAGPDGSEPWKIARVKQRLDALGVKMGWPENWGTQQAESNAKLDIIPHFSFAASATPLPDSEFDEMGVYLESKKEASATSEQLSDS